MSVLKQLRFTKTWGKIDILLKFNFIVNIGLCQGKDGRITATSGVMTYTCAVCQSMQKQSETAAMFVHYFIMSALHFLALKQFSDICVSNKVVSYHANVCFKYVSSHLMFF